MLPTSSAGFQASPPVPEHRFRRYWAMIVPAFAILAFAIMCWRWGGTIQDSQAYFDTARYLRGEIPKSELVAPFPYRLLVPAIASLVPGDLRNNFATLNWLLIVAGACCMSAAVLRIGLGRRRAIAAGLLMIVSLPTFWYAPYLLVDPASICARSAFVLAVLAGQPWLAALAGLLGTAAREENILLLFWLLATCRIGFMPGLAILAAAGGWLLLVRWWLIPGLPTYTWVPNWINIERALHDVRSLLSIAGSSIIVIPLALRGARAAPAALRPLVGLLVLMALPQMYAALSVRVEGRLIWGMYPFLVPFAVCAGMGLAGVRAGAQGARATASAVGEPK